MSNVTPDETAMFKALQQVVADHGEKLTFLQMLAIFAQMTGAMLACNDPRETSREVLSEVIAANIALGLANLIKEVNKGDA
jgi:hypothetical protein